MAQAGLHALVGAAVRKVAPSREWLVLGIILGSLFPDMDNFVVAIATVAKLNTQGLHRTFTHSLLAILASFAVFFVVAKLSKQPLWINLGIGFAIGIAMHMALDLLIWFNGIEFLWPLGGWVNLWEGIKPAVWFSKLLDPAEFLFFASFFAWLAKTAQDRQTNTDFLRSLRVWMIAMVVLLVVFTPLNFAMSKGFTTIFGVFYLISITAAFVITIRMRQTVELLG